MSSTATQSSGTEPPRLFARQATGLVRDVKGWQQIAFNYIAAIPPLILAFTIFFALGGFPGGNFIVGILLTIPLSLAFAYSWGMMSAVIPRSGGDYTIVSRVMHPAVGLVSSCCSLFAVAFGCAFTAIGATTIGLAPALTTVGLVSHSKGLVDAATTISTHKGWEFAIGAAVLIISGLVIGVGWRWTKRLLFGMLAVSLAGLIFSAVVALVTSKSSFIHDFNNFAAGFTSSHDTYHATIAAAVKNGVNVHPKFSLSNTLPLIGVVGSFGIYFWGTAYIAGEIRQASSFKTANRMALSAVLCLGTIAVCVAIFFAGWGRDFLTAGYGGGFPAALGGTPAYFLLTAGQLGSTVISVLLVITFLVAFPASLAYLMVEMSRPLFAWSVDRVLPRQVSDVSRANAPLAATALAVLLCLLMLVWAVFIAKSLIQIATYSTMVQLVAMVLVAVCNIILPHRHPELYQGSASTRRLLGIPVIQIVGVLAIIAAGIFYYLFFKESYFGITGDRLQFFAWLGGAVVVGLIIYFVAKARRRAQGIDLDLAFAEIPPE